MSDVVIRVENLSKQYRLGTVGTGTLSHDINRWWHKLRGKGDPYLKIGEVNDQSVKGDSNYVWALQDINFEVKQGEVLGIIGKNGAGKSTLLKIISRTTLPTIGNIKIKGKVASLLEVGTGFHPELSGRDNIYMNGTILGMTRREISHKFDEIVDFAGVERYIDTPVKRYSSGMYVRLAFAVAAHLEPEILIVDEVLAVGDAEFQKKAIGKMHNVSKSEGRTVIFVSHNMAAVKHLCRSGLVLQNGKMIYAGSAVSSVEEYSKSFSAKEVYLNKLIKKIHYNIIIDRVTINDLDSAPVVLRNNKLVIKIVGCCFDVLSANIEIRIFNNEDILIALYSPGHYKGEVVKLNQGEFTLETNLQLPANLANGDYFFVISLARPNVETYLELEPVKIVNESLLTSSGRSLNYNEVGFVLID